MIAENSLAHNRNYMAYFVGQTISKIGDWAIYFVLLIIAYKITNSALEISLLLIIEMIPSIVFGLIVGVLVDRWNKRMIMIITDIVRSALVLCFLFVHTIYEIYIIVFLISTASTFFESAKGAMIPILVEKQQLRTANSLSALLSTIALTIGPLIGGVLINSTNVNYAFYIDATTFIVSAFTLSLIIIPSTETKPDADTFHNSSLFIQVKEGFDYVKRTPALQKLLLSIALVMVGFGAYNALEVVFAKKVIHASDLGFSLMFLADGTGLVLGSWVLNKFIKNISTEKIFAYGVLLCGVSLAVLPSSNLLALVLLCNFVSGIGNALVVIGIQTLVQSYAPADMLGRIFSLRLIVNNIATLLTMILAAYFADKFGARLVLIFTGSIILVAVFICKDFLKSKKVLTTANIDPTTTNGGLA